MTHVKTPTVTLDDLAFMVKKGFDSVDNRFDDVRLSFEGTNARIEDTNARIDDVNSRFEGINARIARFERGMSYVKENMATKDDITRLESKFDSLEKVIFKDHAPRLRRIEQKLQIA